MKEVSWKFLTVFFRIRDLYQMGENIMTSTLPARMNFSPQTVLVRIKCFVGAYLNRRTIDFAVTVNCPVFLPHCPIRAEGPTSHYAGWRFLFFQVNYFVWESLN